VATCYVCLHNAWLVKAPCEYGEECPFWPQSIKEQTIPCRQKCAACHQIMPVDYHVTDEIWDEAVRPFFRDSIICLNCFISWADEKLLPWDKEIEMWPTSLDTLLTEVRRITLITPEDLAETTFESK